MTHGGTITHSSENTYKTKSSLGTKWEGHKVLIANKMAIEMSLILSFSASAVKKKTLNNKQTTMVNTVPLSVLSYYDPSEVDN